MSVGSINNYLNFKETWIRRFVQIVLPKKYFEDEKIDEFAKILSDFYPQYYLKQYDVNETLYKVNKDETDLLFEYYGIKDKITKFLSIIFLSFNTLANETDEQKRNKYRNYINAIHLALRFDRYIGLEQKTKVTYSKVRKDVLQKFTNIPNELLILLQENKKELQELFDATLKKNLDYIRTNNKNEIFKIDYLKINNKKKVADKSLLLSSFRYSIKSLEDYSSKEIESAIDNNILSNLKKIEVELLSMKIFNDLVDNKNNKVFIELPDYFITNSNIAFIKKCFERLKENVFLKINYDCLEMKKDIIDDLKLLGYKVSFTKGIKEIDLKHLTQTDYLWIDYSKSVDYENTLKIVQDKDIELIVTNIDKYVFNKSNINYSLDDVKCAN